MDCGLRELVFQGVSMTGHIIMVLEGQTEGRQAQSERIFLRALASASPSLLPGFHV